jgi:DNA-binding NtrC family response regulator
MDSTRRRPGLTIVKETAGGPPTSPPAIPIVDAESFGPAMRAVYQYALRVAGSPLPVLIRGETGVGKEVLARTIHQRSPQAGGPFLPLNCGGLTETLADSELFGYERGAFTGAAEAKLGLLEAANGGTVLLDEIGEMPLVLQAKLLRALDSGEILPVGAVRTRAIDVRILAATNRNLEQEVRRGTFRRDLLYRLNAVEIEIPPLRERRIEIPALARRLLADAAAQSGRLVPSLSPAVHGRLASWPWPGNVRELKKAMELALVLCDGPEIDLVHLPGQAPELARPAARARLAEPPARLLSADEQAEKARMVAALEAHIWNQTAAARALGMARRTFAAKMIRYQLPRPRAGQK